jgi:hypothetical protein
MRRPIFMRGLRAAGLLVALTTALPALAFVGSLRGPQGRW